MVLVVIPAFCKAEVGYQKSRGFWVTVTRTLFIRNSQRQSLDIDAEIINKRTILPKRICLSEAPPQNWSKKAIQNHSRFEQTNYNTPLVLDKQIEVILELKIIFP